MASSLEKGIVAARSGNHSQAKTYLVQTLQQNKQNEQAWLWLSEVVDTLGEQISCIERVLEINPNNHTAKLALQKLKSQPSRAVPQPQAVPAYGPTNGFPATAAGSLSAPGMPAHAMPAAGAALLPAAAANQAGLIRRPFRLSDNTSQNAPNGQAIHHQATMALPPMPMPVEGHQAKAATQTIPKPNGAVAKTAEPFNTEAEAGEFPLLPIILFGALSVTALGGLAMIVLLIFFS